MRSASPGVPLRWFTVNRWVTDGPWLERDELDGQLGHITGDTEEKDLTTSWLSIMLRLYRDELQALLKRRDKQLQSYLQGCDRDAVLDDRELYFLSKQEIDMSQMLEIKLFGNMTN